jgi:PTS system ascorbate-specific IIA component
MTVGILLVTHPGLGANLHGLATRMLGQLPLRVECVEVAFDADLDELLPSASAALRRVESAAGVLLLTDLFGATPSNFAERLCQLGTATQRVSGLNLPMLLRVLNYAEKPLPELAEAAAAGGRLGIAVDHG